MKERPELLYAMVLHQWGELITQLNFDACEQPMPSSVMKYWKEYTKDEKVSNEQTYCILNHTFDDKHLELYYTHYFVGTDQCAGAVYGVINGIARPLPDDVALVITRLCGLHISHPETVPQFLAVLERERKKKK